MKSLWLAVVLSITLACSIYAGQGVDAGSPEGQMLGAISKETDPAHKQAMMEEFVKTYPTSTQAGWAWEQLQAAYLQGQQYDRALEAGEKALAVNADDPVVAYNNLKAAEGKGDPDGVIKWSAETSQLARKTIDSAGKSGAADAKGRADYAQQLDSYSEYSIYALALKTTDPQKVIALSQSLQQRNPKSQYMGKLSGIYLNAMRQAGQNDQIGPVAEKLLEADPNSADALFAAADYSMQHQNMDKCLEYSTKLVQVMQQASKPEGVSDADWQKRKNTMLGAGLWMQGLAYNSKRQYQQANTSLRQSLPLLQENKQLLGLSLFALGLADHSLGKAGNRAMMQDALKYFQQSAALTSPVQAQAQANVKAMRGVPGAAHR
jgi:tetratricopeptide (TPR) repeat protein